MISIDFEITKNGHTYRDAIILDDNHGLSDAEIGAMKQQRFDNWYAIVTAVNEEE